MKKVTLLFLVLLPFILAGCNQASDEPTPKSKNSFTIEKEGLIVNFPTEFEVYNRNKEVVWFGPKGPQPGCEEGCHIYNMSLSEKRTFNVFVEEEKIEENYLFVTLKPIEIQINEFDVIKWATSVVPILPEVDPTYEFDPNNPTVTMPMVRRKPTCENRQMELLGNEYNLRFYSPTCEYDRETDFEYFEGIIENIENIKIP